MVWLSTGQQLRLTATLTDTLSDVQSIRFVLHIPPSVRVTAVTYTGGPVSHLERFVVIPNSARGIYDEYTTVMTGTSGLTVTVGASLTSTEIHQNLSAQATGVVDTPIHTRLVS